MPLETRMANTQPTMGIPQSTARVPPSDGQPESDRDSLERDHHDSNDECEDDSPANNALLRKRDEAEERDNDDSNDDCDDDSPIDNALRVKADSADASTFKSRAWRFTGEWSSLYDVEPSSRKFTFPESPTRFST